MEDLGCNSIDDNCPGFDQVCTNPPPHQDDVCFWCNGKDCELGNLVLTLIELNHLQYALQDAPPLITALRTTQSVAMEERTIYVAVTLI